MSVLEKMFNGEIFPPESYNPNENPEYQEMCKEINDYMEQFKRKLSAADYELLDDLIGVVSASSFFGEKYFFSYGFKLATAIWNETILFNRL